MANAEVLQDGHSAPKIPAPFANVAANLLGSLELTVEAECYSGDVGAPE
jgi:hypothetical protein